MGTTHCMGHAHHKDSWGLQQPPGILKAPQHPDFIPGKCIHIKVTWAQRLGLLWETKLNSTVSISLEKKMQLSNPSQILTEKHCWWEKVPGYTWRIQCVFIKKNILKNILTCSLKLLTKGLREATEWWTKEPPSSLFNTFKFTGNNSDKIY